MAAVVGVDEDGDRVFESVKVAEVATAQAPLLQDAQNVKGKGTRRDVGKRDHRELPVDLLWSITVWSIAPG